MNRILIVLFTLSLLVSPTTRLAQAAAIFTDGNYATGIAGLQVPGRGTFAVDFVFDSFDDLFGSALAPIPLPTFWNDTAGGAAAMAAIAGELNGYGGLVGVKDDVSGATAIEAHTGTYNSSTSPVVESFIYLSVPNSWSNYSNVAFAGNFEIMQAIFTQVPEPATSTMAVAGTLLLVAARRRSAGLGRCMSRGA